MLSKVDQHSWFKVDVAQNKNAKGFYRGLLEAYDENGIGRFPDVLNDFIRVGMRLWICNAQFRIPFLNLTLSSLLSIDHKWTVQQLSLEDGLSD
ncbi:hypothetical protein TNCV_1825771 [Trichonephila clavipes]|nr:hypothetical protein TNCV_1825771 [Trichonephila clavipes]